MVHTDPRVGVSHREKRRSLERLWKNLEVDGCCGKLLRAGVADVDDSLHMLCKL